MRVWHNSQVVTGVRPKADTEPMTARKLPSTTYQDIQAGIVTLLESARAAAARSVSAVMTATYWEIGRHIVAFEQGGEQRAEYGEALIRHLAADLTRRFGRGFGFVNLTQMRRFYLAWPPEAIVQTPSELSSNCFQIEHLEPSLDLPPLASRFPLPWSAYVCLLAVRNPNPPLRPRLWLAQSLSNEGLLSCLAGGGDSADTVCTIFQTF